MSDYIAATVSNNVLCDWCTGKDGRYIRHLSHSSRAVETSGIYDVSNNIFCKRPTHSEHVVTVLDDVALN